MADQKLSELTALAVAPAEGDEVYLRDVSEAGESQRKRVAMSIIRLAMGQFLKLKDYSEEQTTPASSSGTLVLDLENGNVFEVTLTENVTTLTLSNPPVSGDAGALTLILSQDGAGSRTFAWPASTQWAGGVAPTVSPAANAKDIYTLITTDAGTTWYGMIGGQVFS